MEKAGGAMSRGGPGLAAMKAAVEFPWECPFCLEAKPPRKHHGGRGPDTCGDPACLLAWKRCWRRDWIASLQVVTAGLAAQQIFGGAP